MSDSGGHAIADLRALLSAGVRSEELPTLREQLSLPDDAGEPALARELVRALSRDQVQTISLRPQASGGESDRPDASRVIGNRGSSFLVQLTDDRGMDLEALEDLRTLLSVVRAGKLPQQRAAIMRIGALLSEPKKLPSAQVREAIETLVHLRKFSLAYELSTVCAQLAGADGRRARNGRREWDKLASSVEQGVREYWDGARDRDPVADLHGDQRMQLLSRARDLSDVVMRHLSAILLDASGSVERDVRLSLAGALRNAGDARLVPVLRALLEGPEAEMLIPAARALARIEDPRVHPILRAAYERTATPELRLVIAGGLGLAGDVRGRGYVREVLASRDEKLLPNALEALGIIGSTDDIQALGELIEQGDDLLDQAVVNTLGRIGDARALSTLATINLGGASSALRAELEEARAAIVARLELLGEEPPSDEEVAQTFDTTKMAAMVKRKDPAAVRFRARWCQLVGYLWLSLGATGAAITRFEAAAALRPDWVAPVLQAANIYARRKESSQALSAFRRALEIDRDAVEDSPGAVRLLAQSFLRRAEAMDRDGREDIARGLLEEALSLDLRQAPSGLRFALSERLDTLKSRGV